MNLISKEISWAEPEYMNMHLLNALDPPLDWLNFLLQEPENRGA